ncbi:conserved hypothetical protein [Sporisorium reilianum SRZ2]|uniref:Uncharacterized protein n=1 Tax=Sporisorium reilianum (strain SRZ2) TaxID=999809 RepID=E6ZV12_SPORE|nr:conserved hypothetical protein [Sporisorium reilianum SRZ2]
MSTLEGAVPLGLGITKLRLWDELHRAHCETMHSTAQAANSLSTQGGPHLESATSVAPTYTNLGGFSQHLQLPYKNRQDPEHALIRAKRRKMDPPESSPPAAIPDQAAGSGAEMDQVRPSDYQTPFSNWFLSDPHGDGCSRIDDANSTSSKVTGAVTDSQGVLMPPPPPKPGPSHRKPPPLVARIKAKARRAKRKQQKAEYRRRLFLAHLVQVTREARQRTARNTLGSASLTVGNQGAASSAASSAAVRITKTKMAQQAIQQAWLLFPECLGVDLGSFVETVFDTDAQSTEITAPSDISDDDLAKATRAEIDNRKRLEGADVQVPKGVFRWMVARNFAQRWPQKMQHVRDNPWSGFELVWGSPSGGAAQGGNDEEPMRWQSGRRSRFIRKKEGKTSKHSGAA